VRTTYTINPRSGVWEKHDVSSLYLRLDLGTFVALFCDQEYVDDF
jgi:hypothetical protein